MASLVKKSIPDFYRNKNILITGGTGFLGAGLVEKLLRSFPQVNKIYLLVRGKNGVNSEERAKNYFDKKLFSVAKLYDPNCSSKIVWVNSDLSQKQCGLSPEAIKTIQNEVNIVFHAGANVSFQQKLKSVLEDNLRGTRDLLEIFKGSKKIESFVYISTVYSNLRISRSHLKETLYPPMVDPKKLLQMVDECSMEELENQKKQLLQDSANVYTFSKNASESLTDTYKEHFPVGVVRPGIIVSAIAEPFPYWIQGNLALERNLREISEGYIFKCNPKTLSSCIPIDMTVNCIIASARAIAEERNKLNIYSFVALSNPVSFMETTQYYMQGIDKRTLALKQYYYNRVLPFKEYVSKIIKYKFREVEQVEKFRYFSKLIEYFINKEIFIDNDNVLKLWESLTPDEQRLLYFNVNSINWKEYFGKMHKFRVIVD